MREYGWKVGVKLVLLAALVVIGGAGTVMANTSSSPNFEISETEFGAGATLDSCSGQYCARASIGNPASGRSEAGESTADFGPIAADSEPMLEVIVESGDSYLGVLETDRTAYKETKVKIRSYLSNGYHLQVIGAPPVYGAHTLHTPATPTLSTPGTEQFGINLATNTIPGVGSDPVQVPSGDMSFGEVLAGYSQPNMFQYSSGDTIASSQRESGRTDYTISMIINVAGSTPAGHYTSDFSVLVIPVF